ncbi:RPA-interacting protein isoform X1 [Cavia porcellus]|uniref:RPA-interacting protein isoform X1 n=1 Tax=Cavia porcellus TaxID=10141 RepID=UPI000661AC6B|nr:RPA-interacting protein isoform X2 [Cavia porcellus]
MAEQAGSHRRSLYKQVGSPHWKEAFRQRCLARMRNSRDRLLNKYRQAGGRALNSLLVQEVMEEEWNSFQSMQNCPEDLAQLSIDLAVLEEIQQELTAEEQSIISEYEKSLQFDEKCLSIMLAEWEANSLICPVCTKYNLRIGAGVVICQCGLHIPSHLTEQKLRAHLEASLNDHSTHCPHIPEFSVTDGPEHPSLLMTCLVGSAVLLTSASRSTKMTAVHLILPTQRQLNEGAGQAAGSRVVSNNSAEPLTVTEPGWHHTACDTWAGIL